MKCSNKQKIEFCCSIIPCISFEGFYMSSNVWIETVENFHLSRSWTVMCHGEETSLTLVSNVDSNINTSKSQSHYSIGLEYHIRTEKFNDRFVQLRSFFFLHLIKKDNTNYYKIDLLCFLVLVTLSPRKADNFDGIS